MIERAWSDWSGNWSGAGCRLERSSERASQKTGGLKRSVEQWVAERSQSGHGTVSAGYKNQI